MEFEMCIEAGMLSYEKVKADPKPSDTLSSEDVLKMISE